MKIIRQNIGKSTQQDEGVVGSYPVEFNSSFHPADYSAKYVPSVGKIHAFLASLIKGIIPRHKETKEEKWRRFIFEWKRSYHPNPNRMLTVNFDQAKLDAHILNGGTVSSFKTPFLDHVRRMFLRAGYPWLAAWVIEVKNCPHMHVLLWVPPDSRLEDQLWRWLVRRYPLPTLPARSSNSFPNLDESGAPFHMAEIDDDRVYSKTGRNGLDGLTDYLAKAIEPNSHRRKGRPIGRIVGRTNDLARGCVNPSLKSRGV